MSLSSVVLPAPLGPIRPTLSPRRKVALKRSISHGPWSSKRNDTSSSSATILPLGTPASISSRTWPSDSRRAARCSRSALAAARRGRRCACAAPPRPCGPRPLPAPAACRRARWPAPRTPARASFGRFVGGEVAGVAAQHAAVELDDARGHRVDEGAVVRDEQQRAAPRHEQALQPLDRVEVEVVGRLVEQQHVGHAPPAPAPARRASWCRPTACARWALRRPGAGAAASARRAAPRSSRPAPRCASAARRGRRPSRVLLVALAQRRAPRPRPR